MTTIAPFAAGSYLTTRNASQLTALKTQLNDLSTQLSSGLTAQTYGGLGGERSTALGAQATLSALNGYAAGITAAQTRTNLAVTTLSQVATLGTNVENSLANGLQSTPPGQSVTKTLAQNNLVGALDALNQSYNGGYIFGGSNLTTRPVLDADTILNGTATQDGLKTIVQEQINADLGTEKNGRISQVGPTPEVVGNPKPSDTQISLTEDASAQTKPAFGFALAGVKLNSQNTGGLAATYSGGNPASIAIDTAKQPAVGDSMTITLNLPDGTSTALTLTAATTADTKSTTSFAIGNSPAATASNLSTAIQNALGSAASSTLTASATARASANFFSASNSTVAAGTAPLRVTYDPTTKEPSYTVDTSGKTVIWYQGDASSSSALSTQTVQVSATNSIGVGARANDPGIQSLLAGLATVAISLPNSSDTNASAIYSAVTSQAQALLTPTGTNPNVQDTVTALSLASSQLSNAASTNTTIQNTLQTTLNGIEQAPTQEVVAKLLDMQTRLQASYQITSSLSKLSLVNYLS